MDAIHVEIMNRIGWRKSRERLYSHPSKTPHYVTSSLHMSPHLETGSEGTKLFIEDQKLSYQFTVTYFSVSISVCNNFPNFCLSEYSHANMKLLLNSKTGMLAKQKFLITLTSCALTFAWTGACGDVCENVDSVQPLDPNDEGKQVHHLATLSQPKCGRCYHDKRWPTCCWHSPYGLEITIYTENNFKLRNKNIL